MKQKEPPVATRQGKPEKTDSRTTGGDGAEITGVSSQTRRNHRGSTEPVMQNYQQLMLVKLVQ